VTLNNWQPTQHGGIVDVGRTIAGRTKGEYFGEQHQGARSGQSEAEMATKTKIEALVNYLKSIQSK
jgi:hypothetical protein